MTDSILYKYRNFNENTLAIFINYELYFSKAEEFNDPFDGQFDLFGGLESFIEENSEFESITDKNLIKKICDEANTEIAISGILSLSEVNNEILMWSHYADHHKGICLGFDKTGLMNDFCTTRYPADYDIMYNKPKPFENLLKQYQNSNLTPFEYLSADVYQILTQYKHKNWAYEKEIRFFKKASGVYSFTPYNIKSVIYGIRTPSRHKKLLNNLINKSNDFEHIVQYQMKRKPGELNIEPELLNKIDLETDGDGKK